MSARLSPGGALLRSSRMFSVPKPLPQPGGEAAAVARHLSPTATTPYPTHQAITTPESSRAIGDWGFKRALPLHKTTKSSTPVVRIRQIDSIEKVTDYRSASDHAITLQKFQEMSLPITLQMPNRSRLGALDLSGTSVFEDDSDFTTLQPGRAEEKRWKFRGPWLAGLTQGEFDKYLRKNVRRKRDEFRSFLKKRLVDQMNAAQHQEALDTGDSVSKQLTNEDITEEELIEYQRKLRSDRVTLYSLVSEFLDLAPLRPPPTLISYGKKDEITKPPSLYAENGPPMSHPSAGISYLRTAAFAENHPIYGPQAQQAPVLARIVQPRNNQQTAKLGVGGFITEVPQGETAFNQRAYLGGRSPIPGVVSFDPDIDGGAKSFVQPQSARVDSSGSIQITVGEADMEVQLIAKEMLGKSKIYYDEAWKPAEPKWSGLRPLAAGGNAEGALRSFPPRNRPAEENRSAEENRPTEEAQPTEEARPAEDALPAEKNRPAGSSQGYGLDLSSVDHIR